MNGIRERVQLESRTEAIDVEVQRKTLSHEYIKYGNYIVIKRRVLRESEPDIYAKVFWYVLLLRPPPNQGSFS